MRRETWGPRVALGVGVVAGAVVAALTTRRRPEMLGLNADVYRVAARAALSGGDLYAVHPEGWTTYRFVYPPAVVLVFLPLAPLSRLGAAVVVALVSVVAGVGLARLLYGRLRTLDAPVGRTDAALVALFVVGSAHAVPSLFFGNVNVVLTATLGAGLLLLDGRAGLTRVDGGTTERASALVGRRWESGASGRQTLAGLALAVPVGLKAFPALFGLWAVRRRAWRAVGTLVGVGLLAGGLSVAVFGVDAHVTYVESALLERAAVGTSYPPNAPYVTVRRPLSVLGVTAMLRGVVAALLVAPVVVYCNTRVETAVDRLVALYALLAGVLIALPSYFVYVVFLYYPLIPLCYLLRGTVRRVFLLGVTAMAVPVTLESVVRVTAPLGGPGPLAPLVTLATPLLWGVGLTLAACVLQRRRRAGRNEGAARRAT